ncbi:MAG: hypothetical protein ABIG93_04430, partial [archaeon]
MEVKTTQDERLVKAVQRELETNPHRDYLNHVFGEVLSGRKCYLWGGAVRDPIIKELYERNGCVKDFDILVDDSGEPIDFRTVFKGENNVFYNRFGTVKLRPTSDFEMDVSRFSNANLIRNGGREKFPVSLETSLVSCDFNTSALAYDLGTGVIYEHGALDAMDREEIDLQDHAGDEPHIMMVRLVLHSDKLGFSIGPKGRTLISESYSPALDENIGRYLDYKSLSGKQERVLQRLNEIASS